MSLIVNRVRKDAYFDSVALMRIAARLKSLPGIDEAGLMIGTPANRELLRDAGILDAEGAAAGPGDLIIAVKASGRTAADAALAEAAAAIDASRKATAEAGTTWQPQTLRTAHAALPDATLALISVPGDYAAAEARKALSRGINAMIFSDNVPLADEIELKREAQLRGLLVMGPDCGTAIIAGVPLGFANVVPKGGIGVIGASGTGIQEVTSLIARAGGGISHALGTGGRDLKAEVGGITTLHAIDLLDGDAATHHILIVSKPAAEAVTRAVLERVAKSWKPFTICFLGASGLSVPANARAAATLETAAAFAMGREVAAASAPIGRPPNGGRTVRGLFAGGTLCSEAQIVALGLERGICIASNVPAPGVRGLAPSTPGAHILIDLGDDAFTRGRPHPMIEPAVRDTHLAEALADPSVGVVLLDVVLGTGGHGDPAGHLSERLAGRAPNGAAIVASVTGTEGDRQGLAGQIAKLEAAGLIVAPSNAAAARMAFASVLG